MLKAQAIWTVVVQDGLARANVTSHVLQFQRQKPHSDLSCRRIHISRYTTSHPVHIYDLPAMDYPGAYTYASLLQGCVNNKSLRQGKLVHAHIIQTEFNPNTYLSTKLQILYASCGSLVDARKVFDKMFERNVVSWTAMIAAYARFGFAQEALALFGQMQQTGTKPDHFCFASILPACATLAALCDGKEVHCDVIKTGFHSDMIVGNALVDMYAKCARMEDARKLFDKMSGRDVVTWTAIITGYAQNGNPNESLRLFREMGLSCLKPNTVTMAGVLTACTKLAALKQGKEVHKYIIGIGLLLDAFVVGMLVDMYAKCGSIEYARKMFDKSPERDTVLWTAMIVGYATHGFGKEAVQLFEEMQVSGSKPDHVTLLGVLSACCHVGLVDDGCQYYEQMTQFYHIKPAVEHYCCMVDLLGRSGRLNEAQEFINKMPIEPNAAIWASLLGACRIHNNIELGEHAAEQVFKLEPKNSAHYLVLSNIYSAAGRWNEKSKVRNLMKDRQVTERPGCSWIEVNNNAHVFQAKDRSHPQSKEIYAELKRLTVHMREAGYIPTRTFLLHDDKED